MISFKRYSDRIAHLKKLSGYHFDPFRDEQPLHRILGWFTGAPWMEEVLAAEQEATASCDFGFANCCHAQGPGEHGPNYQFDLELTNDKSYDTKHIFLSKIPFTREKAPTLAKMVDWFGFAPGTASARIHVQHPGQVFPLHIDGLVMHTDGNVDHRSEDVGAWARVQIQLEDWVWGHVWGVGNNYWSQWRAGEIMYHPWWNVPHATANCSYAPRYSIQITGKITELTKTRIASERTEIEL